MKTNALFYLLIVLCMLTIRSAIYAQNISQQSEQGEKERVSLQSVPESYRRHPEYGKTKLNNPAFQDSYELIQHRTADSRLFQNLDGSLTLVKSGEPLHYKDKTGMWRTVNIKFEKKSHNPFIYQLTKQRLPVTFNNMTSEITMQLDSINDITIGRDLAFTQIDNNGNPISKKKQYNAKATVDMEKPKASISNIFDDIDMSILFNNNSTKTNFIILSPSNIDKKAQMIAFSQKIEIPLGWSFDYDKRNGVMIDGYWQGDIVLTNSNGEVMSKFIKPVYYDANPDRTKNNITGYYKLEKNENESYTINIIVPVKWLLDSNRIYPVTIDPIVMNNDYIEIPSCVFPSYYSSNLSVLIPVGNLITNTYISWTYDAVGTGWMEDQVSYVTGVNGSTPIFYGSGQTAGSQQYALNTTIGNGVSTGNVSFTFNTSRTNGGTACDLNYNYLSNRYLELTYINSICSDNNSYYSNVDSTGYAPCGSYATAFIPAGKYQKLYAFLGSSYTINTCETNSSNSLDTQISGFQDNGTALFYNDDGNTNCSNNGFSNGNTSDSWVDWSSSVDGWVHVQVTKYNCAMDLSKSAILNVKENLPTTPSTPILNPSGGNYCMGENVIISAAGYPLTGVSWYWQTTPYGVSTINSEHSFVVTSDGTYYLRPRSSSGCWGNATSGVTVSFIYFPCTVNNFQSICQGDSYLINGHHYSNQGTYYDTLSTIHGCDSIVITQLNILNLPTVNLGSDDEICFGQNATLNPGNPNLNTYLWSTGETTVTINVGATGTYWVSAIDSNGCKNSDTIQIISLLPSPWQICFVEFDTITQKNNINWSSSLPANADSINIYKEISLNVWTLIGIVPKTINHFVDTASMPSAQSYSYKIAVKDTCGNESILSTYHTTITLLSTYDSGTNTYGFTWSPYYGLVVSNYYLYGVYANGTAVLIGSVPGNQYMYNYVNPSPQIIRYFVAFETPACSAKTNVLVKSNWVQSVLNNIKTPQSIPFSVHPNPATAQVEIVINASNFKVELLNVLGQILLSEHNIKSFNMQSLPAGTYVIRITVNGIASQQKLIKF